MRMRMCHVWLFLFLGSICGAQDKTIAEDKAFSTKIDKIVLYGLKKLKQRPTKPCNDDVFVRRIYLDTIGRIPTYFEYSKYMSASPADRRQKLIDELLNSEAYVSHNFNYWADVLRPRRVQDSLEPENYSAFIKQSLRENKTYDKFVYEMLSAKGEVFKPGNGATGYYMRDAGMPLDNLSNSMKIFLGTSMECAQCHDHPYSKWTQLDFYKLAAFTSGVKMNRNVERRSKEDEMYKKDREIFKPDFAKAQVFGQVTRIKHSSIENTGLGVIRLPHDYDYDDARPHQAIKAEVPFGPKIEPKFTDKSLKELKYMNTRISAPEINSRKTFAEWVTSKQNPLFAKTIANRMWAKIMGAPFVGNLTDITAKKKGVNPYLTKELTTVMAAINFDLKRFQRIIFNSKTYQRETARQGLDSKTKYAFHGPLLKRLSAEQIWDSILSMALANPDASIRNKNQYGPYDYFFTKVANMKASDMAKYVKDHDYNRGTFMKALRKEAAQLNDKRGGNMKLQLPKKSKNMIEYEKLSAQISKAQQQKKYRDAKKLESKRLSLKRKMTRNRENVNMMVSMKSQPSGPEYTRASELSSPAPPNHFLAKFGQSERVVIDGASAESSIPQAFTLMNGKIEDMLILNDNSYLMKNLNSAQKTDEKITIAFNCILSRKPKYSEMALFKDLFSRDSKSAERDLVWTLLNSNEFIFKR